MKDKIFNRDDIKAGYLLVVKDKETGEQFNMTVVPGNRFNFGKDGDLGCCFPSRHWWPLENFDRADLTNGDYQVIEVYGHTNNRMLLDNSTEDRDLIWKREKDVKKMTLAEICEALGYDVEVVK